MSIIRPASGVGRSLKLTISKGLYPRYFHRRWMITKKESKDLSIVEEETIFYDEKMPSKEDNNMIRENSDKPNFIGKVNEDVKIVVADDKEDNNKTLMKNMCYLCSILQMIPVNSIVCKVSLATGFTVMFLFNAEYFSLKWLFSFR